MFAKTVKYTDFDGNEREETYYFHLTKEQLMFWLSTNSDYTLDKLLLDLGKKGDLKGTLTVFKELILDSYGEKTLDGRGFTKTPQMRQDFSCTEAFSKIFCDIIHDEKSAMAFVKGILPRDVREEIEKLPNPEDIPDLRLLTKKMSVGDATKSTDVIEAVQK